MITVDIFKAREQLDNLIDDVNINNTPLTIINDKGNYVVDPQFSDYNSLANIPS